MPLKTFTFRIFPDIERKFDQALEIRNLELAKQGSSTISKSTLVNEAINFYYAYLTGNAMDGQINALYENELNRALRNQMKPVYSMMNRMNYVSSINQKLLKIIFSELNKWPDEERIKKEYPLLFPIEKVVEELEKAKSKED